MLENGYRFDAFKIGCNNYLLITLVIQTGKKTIKYEIFGDQGTHVKRRIEGCDREMTISQIVNVDEILVFKYKIDNEKSTFKFIKYNELIKSKVNKMNVDSKNCYIIQKNIHMNVDYVEEETNSKDELDFYEDSSEDDGDDDDSDMYKPISDMEDDDCGIMSLFHLEEDGDEEEEGIEEIDTGWTKPEAIKTDDIIKKNMEGNI